MGVKCEAHLFSQISYNDLFLNLRNRVDEPGNLKISIEQERSELNGYQICFL